MGLLRLISWVILSTLAYWLWRKLTTKNRTEHDATRNGQNAPLMVRCAHCEVFLPQAQAVNKNQQWYCSPVHAQHGKPSSER